MKTYIAGRMRSIAQYNFPAFDAAAQRLRDAGHDPVNPADLDRAIGINETTDPLPAGFLRGAMQRDLAAICGCDAIALLPGWQASAGANLELSLAKLLGLKVIDAVTLEPYHESILSEAERLTNGDRNTAYGHPLDDFERTAAIWSAIIGHPVTAEQAILCMVGVKISRECHQPKRDSRVDLAGYANCLDMVHREKARRNDP